MKTELDDLFGSATSSVIYYDIPLESAQNGCPPPGIYYDIPAHEYHAWGAISSTLLKGYAALPSMARTPFVPGDDANVGSGVHAYSLQGEDGLAAECFILPPECEGTSKAAKQARAEYELLHPHKALLPHRYGPGAAETKPPIMEVLQGVDNSLRAHPKVGPVLERAQKEVSLVWVDAETGCQCKARLDIWDETGKVVWDLKKVRNISGFAWQIRDLEYLVQAGMYMEGAIACGLPAVAFGFIPCEAYHPYQVDCGYVDPEKLAAARWNARRLIGLVKQSTITGNWPNYRIPEHICNLDEITPDDLVKIY